MLFTTVSFAQATNDTSHSSALVVAARVNADVVYRSEVEREYERVFKNRLVDKDAELILRAQTLQQLVDRRLVLQFLSRKQFAPSKHDLSQAFDTVTQRLALRELTLAEFLKRANMQQNEFLRALEWHIAWQSYLDTYLTVDNLKTYFSDHQRDFDGTQLHLAQILFRVSPQEPDNLSKAIEQATTLRHAIIREEIDFPTAARKYSQSPSAKNGGDIGTIARRDPMPEVFSRPAFALDVDEISQPIVSPFGVHLIHCLEIQPGGKPWDEVIETLVPAVTTYLFEWIADQGRGTAKISFPEDISTKRSDP
ncbi:MAG: peptidylprolyl isomerase [Pirellulaceae bacterium]|nr:peptidylprolyl isomerase [Pirellulaceae bacterium]